jgi:hypothetical protein
MQSQPHLESYTARPTGRATEISVWHVAVSSDDVKVMTLEQLDDAFRLDIIDTSTPVWKTGMSTWSSLGVVAGIDDEPTTAHVSVRQEPAALWPPPAWPPQAGNSQSHVNAVSNWEAAPSRSPAPPTLRPTVAPSGPNVRSAAPAAAPRAAAPVSRPAPAARPAPPSARTVQVANFAMPASVPPAAYSVPPQYYARPQSSSSFGSWVLGLAVVAGLLVTAYRNDLLLRGARAAHVEAPYLRIERALLGGPSFGTLRSVAALKIREKLVELTGTSKGTVVTPAIAQPVAAAVAPALPVVPAKPAEPQAQPKTPPGAVDLRSLPVESDTQTPAAAAPSQPAPVAKAPVKAPAPAPAAKPAPAKPAAPVAVAKKEPAEKPAPAQSEPSDALKAAMAGKAAKASSEPPPAKEAAAKSGGELPRTKSGELDLKAAIGDAVRRHPPKKKKGAPGSEYDPLNGDL